jgi:virulence-associated protein VagC
MSKVTQHHLADELCRRIEENYHNPKHITMRGKAKAVSPSEMARRLPKDLTFGSVRVKIRINDSLPTGSFTLDFKKLVKRIDYKTGQEEEVAVG